MTPEQKYKLVPVEPTPEMMRSGMSVPLNKAARHNAVYRAMLAAAPTPAEAPADVARDAEPVAYVTGVYGGHTTVAPIDAAQVLRVGMALYTAPPAPSVPDGWKLVPVEPTPEPFGYFKAEPFGWTDCAETDDGAIALFDVPPAPTPAEAPADVARDAELLRKLKHSIGQAKISGNYWRRELELMSSMIDAAMSEKGGA